MGLRMKKDKSSLKNPILRRGRGMKNQYTGGELPKRGANYLKKRG